MNTRDTLDTSPVVINIYPSSDTLPENLLRMYVHFSKPMKTVNNLENIKIIDENNNEVTNALFNNVYELWDSEQKILTLIFDPSRVKTGLLAHEELGRPLSTGKRYRLVIESAEDIYGLRLNSKYVKHFYVTEADLNHPDINKWIINNVEKNSKAPIVIEFPQSIDLLSLYHRIRIVDSNNQFIRGDIEILNNEQHWIFIPHDNWKAGSYQILVNGRLEDPAGNNLNGIFDHKTGAITTREDDFYHLHFRIAE